MAEHAGLIPIGQAARLLMISEERIRQLVKQGYVPKPEKRGFVQLVGAVQGYLRYLKDDERRSAKSAADISADLTVAGTPAAGDTVIFQVSRAPANGADTMAVDARLLGIAVLYTIDAAKDD